AGALDKWMGEHGFVYPKGMDGVVEDYVKQKWCFVAEKTRVANRAATDPKPGMRKVDPSMPGGASFDGYVQGMGFRFRSSKLVLPMRLSPFNEGEKRQIVYVLSAEPVKVDGVSEERVMRQVDGPTLVSNLTELLPVRVVGGKPSQVTK